MNSNQDLFNVRVLIIVTNFTSVGYRDGDLIGYIASVEYRFENYMFIKK